MTTSKQQKNDQLLELYDTYKDRYHNLLKNVIKQSSSMHSIDKEAYSIAVTGGFGTGKTIFLKGLENYINKQSQENGKAVAVYIDSQRFDYLDSPHEILAMLLEDIALSYESNSKKIINSVVFALRNITPDKYKKVVRRTMTVFKSAYKEKKKLAITKLGNSLSEDNFSISVEMLEKIEQEVIQNLDNFLFEDNFSHSVQMLEKLAQDIIPNSGAKFILIIDELDRTSPAYSLKFLETMRHLLPINNIIFIFGINYKQMRAIVQNHYGIDDSDAATYFAKYFKHTYDLEAWQKIDLPKFHEEKFNYFFDALFPQNAFPDKQTAELLNVKYPHVMCALFNLSLREMRDVVILLRENLVAIPNKNDSNASWLYNFIVVMFLLCIKTKHPTLLEKIIHDGGETDELLSYFVLVFKKAPKQLISEYNKNNYPGPYMSPVFLAIIEIIVYACDKFKDKKSSETFYTIVQEICDHHGLKNIAEKSEHPLDTEYDAVEHSKETIPYNHIYLYYIQANQGIDSNISRRPTNNEISLRDMAIRLHS